MSSNDNAKRCAYPTPIGAYVTDSGMTKREIFAAMAMQGLLASLTKDDADLSPSVLARCAVCNADALLVELEKKK